MFQSDVKGYAVRRGKVRDIYDVAPDKLVIVSTDRISAFDRVLDNEIPEKGKILTGLTKFWLDLFGSSQRNHLLSTNLGDMPPEFQASEFERRTMLVRKCDPFPVECIVRGYLAGSAWKEYQNVGTVCMIGLPAGLQENMNLSRPLFTPSTKADVGHDENISKDEMARVLANRMEYPTPDMTGIGYPCMDANALENLSTRLYTRAHEYAWNRGVIIADTKFEWGRDKDRHIVLIDEVLTPDSSRYWPLAGYRLGGSPPSLDKQYVRDYLTGCGWDRDSPPPRLPDDVVRNTTSKYVELYERLVGVYR